MGRFAPMRVRYTWGLNLWEPSSLVLKWVSGHLFVQTSNFRPRVHTFIGSTFKRLAPYSARNRFHLPRRSYNLISYFSYFICFWSILSTTFLACRPYTVQLTSPYSHKYPLQFYTSSRQTVCSLTWPQIVWGPLIGVPGLSGNRCCWPI